MKIGLIITVLIAIFLGWIGYSTFIGERFRVEVCMAFNGKTACKTVSAKANESAIRSGATNACADIASGVTETMQCESRAPISIKWLHRPGKQ